MPPILEAVRNTIKKWIAAPASETLMNRPGFLEKDLMGSERRPAGEKLPTLSKMPDSLRSQFIHSGAVIRKAVPQPMAVAGGVGNTDGLSPFSVPCDAGSATAPHLLQKFAPSFRGAPHFWQMRVDEGGAIDCGVVALESGCSDAGAGLPHLLQNLAPSFRGELHFWQRCMT